jgi:hypothetical protein
MPRMEHRAPAQMAEADSVRQEVASALRLHRTMGPAPTAPRIPVCHSVLIARLPPLSILSLLSSAIPIPPLSRSHHFHPAVSVTLPLPQPHLLRRQRIHLLLPVRLSSRPPLPRHRSFNHPPPIILHPLKPTHPLSPQPRALLSALLSVRMFPPAVTIPVVKSPAVPIAVEPSTTPVTAMHSTLLPAFACRT